MTSKNVNEIKEAYNDKIVLSENNLYQIGSVFFENKGGYNISNILTDFTKLSTILVDKQLLIKEQKAKTNSIQNIVKMLEKINKNLMIDNKKQYFKYNKNKKKYINLKDKKNILI